MAIRDIRSQLPLTAQTDPNKFPVVDYQRYPLAPTDKNGKHYLDEFDRLVTLRSKEEEDAFRADHPDMREVADFVNPQDELARLRAELDEANAKLAAQNPPVDPNAGDTGAAGLVKQAQAGDPTKEAPAAAAAKPKPSLGKKLD